MGSDETSEVYLTLLPPPPQIELLSYRVDLSDTKNKQKSAPHLKPSSGVGWCCLT